MVLLLAVDTGGSCSTPACEAPFFPLLQSKHILQMWLCVCRPRSGMKASPLCSPVCQSAGSTTV